MENGNNIAVIILAAGLGTRMKSNKAKVLHEMAGRAMLMYVLDTAIQVAGKDVIVVVGHQADRVEALVSSEFEVRFALQREQLGTGHAVQCALPHIPAHIQEVVILCGDVPLLKASSVMDLVNGHIKAQRHLSLLAVEMENPSGYGRVFFDSQGRVAEIIEEADANEAQKGIKTINSGIYCVKKEFLFEALTKINRNNVQGELYLTDIIEIGYKSGRNVGALVSRNIQEFIGVNTCADLEMAETICTRANRKIS